MLQKHSGVILVTVLLFLFLFSLLAITSLQNSQLQMRMANNLTIYHQMLQAVTVGLKEGEQQLLTIPDSACIVYSPTENMLIHPWLVGKSCRLSYNDQSVHYIIQQLMPDVCIVIGIEANEQVLLEKGALFQITAWIEQFHQPAIAWQVTYAKTLGEDCIDPANKIKPGLLSWREINLFR